MPPERLFVFDTNVLISALLIEQSIPQRAVLEAMRVGRILISGDLVVELLEALHRPKFERYITAEERDQFLTALILEGALIEVTQTVAAARDPKDNHILSLAVSGNAEVIVTGDRDLLALHPLRGIDIVSPASFLARIEEGRQP